MQKKLNHKGQSSDHIGKHIKDYLRAGAGGADWREACMAASS